MRARACRQACPAGRQPSRPRVRCGWSRRLPPWALPRSSPGTPGHGHGHGGRPLLPELSWSSDAEATAPAPARSPSSAQKPLPLGLKRALCQAPPLPGSRPPPLQTPAPWCRLATHVCSPSRPWLGVLLSTWPVGVPRFRRLVSAEDSVSPDIMHSCQHPQILFLHISHNPHSQAGTGCREAPGSLRGCGQPSPSPVDQALMSGQAVCSPLSPSLKTDFLSFC